MTQLSQIAPILFEDSLSARAAPMRYRKVGSPYAFLNSIGIDAILERIYKAANVVDIAKELGISITILLNWVENEGFSQRIEDAYKFSAEGYLSEAGSALREAKNDFDLKKAKLLGDHGRFMASKLDKSTYGADNKQVGNSAGVTFIMHMGQGVAPRAVVLTDTPMDLPPPREASFIQGEYNLIPNYPEPDGVAQPDSIGPFENAPFEPDVNNAPEYLKA